jgi:hypothetical protein
LKAYCALPVMDYNNQLHRQFAEAQSFFEILEKESKAARYRIHQ